MFLCYHINPYDDYASGKSPPKEVEHTGYCFGMKYWRMFYGKLLLPFDAQGTFKGEVY